MPQTNRLDRLNDIHLCLAAGSGPTPTVAGYYWFQFLDRDLEIGHRLAQATRLFFPSRRDISLPFPFSDSISPIAGHASRVRVPNGEN